MFQAIDKRTGTPRRVFGVHKSGPLDDQTKFLIFHNGWRWVWATHFTPVEDVALQPIDLLAAPPRNDRSGSQQMRRQPAVA